MKGPADYLKLGDHNAVCFECGRKRKASTMKKHWQGYWVCPEHWEARHPQDFVRAMPDHQAPAWTQPPADTFALVCSFNGMTAIAAFAVAGCAIAGYISPMLDRGDPPYLDTVIRVTSEGDTRVTSGRDTRVVSEV